MSKNNQAPKVDPMVLAAQVQELQLKLAQAEEETTRLKANKAASGGIKIGKAGGVSVYGLGKWPVTLYLSQWETLFDKIPEVKAFIEANRSKLKTKD